MEVNIKVRWGSKSWTIIRLRKFKGIPSQVTVPDLRAEIESKT